MTLLRMLYAMLCSIKAELFGRIRWVSNCIEMNWLPSWTLPSGGRRLIPSVASTGTGPVESERPVWKPQCCTHSLHSSLSHSHIHTHTVLVYLSGCRLLSVWLGSLCLSACPPHKPNNATLLRLWPPAQWKKKKVDDEEVEEEVMKEEGEMESEERLHVDRRGRRAGV